MAIEACYVYIDAGYVRATLKQAGVQDEFDPRAYANYVGDQRFMNTTLWALQPTRIFVYDAVDDDPQTPEAAHEAQRRTAHLARVQRLPDTHVVTGFLRRGQRGQRQQKGVDVALAVDALEAASAQRVKAIALVAGDADFAPLADAVRRAGPHVIVIAFPSSLAAELRAAADRVISLPEPPPDTGIAC